MSQFNTGYLYLVVPILIFLVVFIQARSIRARQPLDEYASFEGKKVKFASAEIGGQRYGTVIEFKLGEDLFGVKCYFPYFSMVATYEDITLSKSRALIGSMVEIKMPASREDIIISHRLAKKLENISNGRLGYTQI